MNSTNPTKHRLEAPTYCADNLAHARGCGVPVTQQSSSECILKSSSVAMGLGTFLGTADPRAWGRLTLGLGDG
jgi:hypothetical protein